VIVCSDAPFTPTPADQAALTAQQPSGPGTWVVRTCTQDGNPFQRIVTWDPTAAKALPAPAILAARAASKLRMPNPAIQSSPGNGTPAVTQLPTWAWIPAAQWAPLSATATVPGESVTATATPASVTWSWGDGAASVCHGPGTPFLTGTSNPADPSPDCGHTYQSTSGQQPGLAFPVTATITWTITWNGGGQAGVLPALTTTSTARWTVEQVQSVIVN
jgi:hypothetical protein